MVCLGDNTGWVTALCSLFSLKYLSSPRCINWGKFHAGGNPVVDQHHIQGENKLLMSSIWMLQRLGLTLALEITWPEYRLSCLHGFSYIKEMYGVSFFEHNLNKSCFYIFIPFSKVLNFSKQFFPL